MPWAELPTIRGVPYFGVLITRILLLIGYFLRVRPGLGFGVWGLQTLGLRGEGFTGPGL